MEWEGPASLHFAFHSVAVEFPGLTRPQHITRQLTPKEQKTYRFLHVGDRIAALASSAGGFILMAKESNFSGDA